MILQINGPDQEVRYIDGIRCICECVSPGDREIDLSVGESPKLDEGEVEITTTIVCQLIPKYGGRGFVVYLHTGARAWLLNDEGKTLHQVF